MYPRRPQPNERVLLTRHVSRFAQFVRVEFDPTCAQSWRKADELYRQVLSTAGVRK